jgi:hypothetical protein
VTVAPGEDLAAWAGEPLSLLRSSRASLRVGAGLRAFHCIYDEG